MSRHIIVDGDVLVYRCAWSEKNSPVEEAVLKMDELVGNIKNELDPWNCFVWHFYLTGKTNFRVEIAKSAVYKGNRKDTPKPPHLRELREHLIVKHSAKVSVNCEADDMVAIKAAEVGYDNAVIVSIDKDFNQVPTTIFNPTKWTYETVTPYEAMLNFYKQILTGDTVDNIIGIHGIGPKKADKLLCNLKTEEEMFAFCVGFYSTAMTEPEKAYDRVVENARLLYIQRSVGELWQPPLTLEEVYGKN